MITVEKSIFINRSQAEVFDFVSDPNNSPKWQKQFLSIGWKSEKPHGVGSTQHSVTRFLGRDIETIVQITFWDPPNKFTYKSVSGPFPIEGGTICEREGSGTKVTLVGQGDIGGFFKLAEGMVKKQLESQFLTNLGALKTVLEAGSE